jgi:transposase
VTDGTGETVQAGGRAWTFTRRRSRPVRSSEDEAGQTSVELAEFGGFKRDRQAMAQWVAAHGAEMVVMESTGIYWKSPHAALEQVGIVATVVNARHVKTVPGRKTDWADAQWLAMLARAGMLRASFVPPAQFRALRHVGTATPATDRHPFRARRTACTRLLSDGGIRLSVVVSDIHGVAGRAMVKALIAESLSRRGVDARRQPSQGRSVRNCSMRSMANSPPTTASCCMN